MCVIKCFMLLFEHNMSQGFIIQEGSGCARVCVRENVRCLFPTLWRLKCFFFLI